MMSDSKMGKLLPNLTVTVGKDKSDLDESLEDGEISDAESISDSDTAKKEIVRNWMHTLRTPKVYTNKLGGFETGIDLSSPSLIKKLEARAERFGLDKKERSQITQLEIDALYKSLGLDPGDLKSGCRNIRLKVIHIRGVTEMSTKEVLDYFMEYGPTTVEWINDISCNVCFSDELSAARSLISLSKPFVIKRKNRNQDNFEESPAGADVIELSDTEEEIKESDEEKDKLRDRRKYDTESDSDEEAEKPLENDDTTMEVDDQHNSNSDDGTKTASINMPVPPGYWRLGVPHEKAKALLLRFATTDDKKAPGAEKRSQYYQKYGNPNYGGLKGLISTSRKRRFQSTRNKELISGMSASSSYDPLFTPEYERRSKVPRMKMYADEEEERRKKVGRSYGRVTNIKDRLGKKYTTEDFHFMSRDFSDEDESSDQEELSVNCKIPSKFKIWNDQAKLMGEAERRHTRESSFRPRRFEEREHDDFRLKSSVHKTEGLKDDLRSRIKSLKDDKPNKHRSPLCVDSD